MTQDASPAWHGPAWAAAATAWLDARLTEAGRARTGEVVQREQPWAAVLQAPTADGDVWLKATRPGTTNEAAAYAVLVETAPDAVLTPIALDRERGWVLLPDGGPNLDELHALPERIAAMQAAVPVYARLQQAAAPHAAALVDAGLPDARPDRLPALLDAALAATAAHAHAAGQDHEHAAVAALAPAVATWAAELAGAPGGESIDHNDLHPGNVLAGARFYDWGDAVVAHPFASLRTVRRALWQLGATTAEVERVTDAYLEAWTDRADRAALARTAWLAWHTGAIARALVWHRAVGDDPGPWVGAAWQALRTLLEQDAGL